ncbi:MAG: sigma-54 interaction domain-containing protein, partial [Bacteroidota bacterium]
LNIAARVAPSKASVLIRGESGTGKELIARAIHQSSDRADRPFVVVNCAAMPDTLFESELFGHEKGAFTSADRQRTGKFEEADGGTLFIDEVGDIPLMIQVKLLRAVQFGEIMRLGSNKVIRPDVRIITATNRNLEKMIREGEFREDLYYRFNVVNIDIPPLRSRRLDIPPLIDRFLEKFAGMNKKDVASLSKEARDALMKYDFPGNVRELENIIQRAVVLTREEVITLEDLPDYVKKGNALSGESEIGEISVGDLNEKVEQLERQMIEKALDQTGGNQSKAAELLNISERTLRYKLSKYGK